MIGVASPRSLEKRDLGGHATPISLEEGLKEITAVLQLRQPASSYSEWKRKDSHWCLRLQPIQIIRSLANEVKVHVTWSHISNRTYNDTRVVSRSCNRQALEFLLRVCCILSHGLGLSQITLMPLSLSLVRLANGRSTKLFYTRTVVECSVECGRHKAYVQRS